jgi:dTDP-4-dehydrorhamnose 3,5-epimerase
MKIHRTHIEGLLILEPRLFRDSRGYFYESYHKGELEGLGIRHEFLQDNQSRSVKGVIRGLHFQRAPHTQTKLVRVTEGLIYDVAVDLRKGSAHFGQWYGVELSNENHLQLMIPKGFAHGFSVLSEHATIQYKCDAYYHPESDAGILLNDPDLQIDWKVDPDQAIISDKDRALPLLKDIIALEP